MLYTLKVITFSCSYVLYEVCINLKFFTDMEHGKFQYFLYLKKILIYTLEIGLEEIGNRFYNFELILQIIHKFHRDTVTE